MTIDLFPGVSISFDKADPKGENEVDPSFHLGALLICDDWVCKNPECDFDHHWSITLQLYLGWSHFQIMLGWGW